MVSLFHCHYYFTVTIYFAFCAHWLKKKLDALFTLTGRLKTVSRNVTETRETEICTRKHDGIIFTTFQLRKLNGNVKYALKMKCPCFRNTETRRKLELTSYRHISQIRKLEFSSCDVEWFFVVYYISAGQASLLQVQCEFYIRTSFFLFHIS